VEYIPECAIIKLHSYILGVFIMKIAIIGAPDSVNKVYATLSAADSDTKFIARSAEKIDDMINLIQDIESSVDGFYLTGTGVYSALNEKTNITKPVVYTKRGITGVIKSFWEFQKDKDRTFNLKDIKLGLDVIEEKDFLEALNEFEIEIDSYYLQRYKYQKSETEYLNEYLEKIKRNEINCIFTAFGHIYFALKEKNFPVYRLQATNVEIIEEFKNLQNRIKMARAEKSKISVEVIKLLRHEGILNNILADKVQFEKELLSYSREVDGNIQVIGDDEYLILSNKGLLNAPENIRTLISIIKNKNYKGFSIAVGIGEGNTIFQSEKNARFALKLSINEGNNNIFFSNGQEVKGPVMEKREINYKYSSDKKISEISKTTGVSPVYLEKIKSIMRKQEKNIFTSRELAEFLNISERSVNRIIKKIIENNYAVPAEYESSAGAGRPRRKTQFTF